MSFWKDKSLWTALYSDNTKLLLVNWNYHTKKFYLINGKKNLLFVNKKSQKKNQIKYECVTIYWKLSSCMTLLWYKFPLDKQKRQKETADKS